MDTRQISDQIDATVYKAWSAGQLIAAIAKIDAELEATRNQPFSKVVTRIVLQGDRDELAAELATRERSV